MRSRNSFIRLALGGGLITLLAAGMLWAQDDSHARIVRLSLVEGTVTVQRPDVPDWSEAPVNTPLQEGFKLSTAESSFAEVEFENGSTLRLGQLSLLEFSQLALQPSGGKINRLALLRGYATVHAMPEGGDDVYELNTPQGLITARGKALFRVDLDENLERVEVFKGKVDVASNLGAWSLALNDVLELQPGADESYSLTQGITQDAWDEWVSERESRAAMASSGGAPSPRLYSNDVSDLLYGWGDLSNYGMWSNLQGLGYGWVPAVGAGWSPYSLGRWCWYPGFGWTWISSEPWGWLPFHYGGWEYLAGIGWAWFPDSFAYFSPAEVIWYSGPGWIGWVPRGSPRGGHLACPARQACGTAVSSTTFQNGIAVAPTNRLPIDPVRGQRIDNPSVPTSHITMLPGPGAPRIGMRGRPASGSPGTPRTVTLGPRGEGHASPAPGSTLVFDPAQDRYVNNNVTPRPAQTPQEPGEASGGTVGHWSATAPGPRPKEPTTSPSPPGYFNPGAPADSGKPHSMGPPRDAAPTDWTRSGPAGKERSGGDTHWNSAGSQRGGGAGESGSAKSAGGQFEGGGKSVGRSGGGDTSHSGGGASPAHGGSGSAPHPH